MARDKYAVLYTKIYAVLLLNLQLDFYNNDVTENRDFLDVFAVYLCICIWDWFPDLDVTHLNIFLSYLLARCPWLISYFYLWIMIIVYDVSTYSLPCVYIQMFMCIL